MKQRNILLIGKTGDGKSSAGNTILRKKVFTPKASASSATDEPVTGCGLVNGRKIKVINTPGFFDTDQDDKYTKSKIIKAMMDTPKIHAIVFVLKVGRYTKHENEVVEELLKLTKEEHVRKHTVILFTFGDQLEDQTLKEFIKSNSKLQEFVTECEGRCHVIDNKYWNDCHSGEKSNRVQLNNLLATINKMVQKNGCFTSEALKNLEVMKNKINNLPSEDQQKAKKMVHNKILKQVVGATTGAVIGAFLGVGVLGVILFEKPLKGLLKLIALTGIAAAAAVKAAEVAAVVETGAVAAVVETGAVAAVVETGAVAAVVETGAVAAVVETGAVAAVVETGAVAAVVETGAVAAVVETGAVAAVVETGAVAAVVETGAVAAVVETGAVAAVVETGAVAAVVETGAVAAVVETGAVAAVVETGAVAAVVETGAVAAVVETGAVAEASGAAAGAGVSTGTVIAGSVIGTAALIGGVAGGITGWKAAEDADSVYDAMKKAAQVNYENGKAVVEMAQEIVSLLVNNKKDH